MGSRARRRNPSLAKIMDFKQEAAAIRFEGAVDGAGRAAGVSAGRKAFAAAPLGIVTDGQVAVDQIDLLPVFVDKGGGGKDAGGKAQEPRPAAAALILVERAGEDLLLDPLGIAGRRRPAGAHV